MAKPDPTIEPVALKLNEICKRLGVSYRDANYALHHGMIRDGVDPSPGSGRHRLFNWDQAMSLATVLKLKVAGVKPHLAAEIANWLPRLRDLNGRAGWDQDFSPIENQVPIEEEWVIEIGDGRFIRLAIKSNPDVPDGVWIDTKSRQTARDASVSVVIQINFTQLALSLKA